MTLRPATPLLMMFLVPSLSAQPDIGTDGWIAPGQTFDREQLIAGMVEGMEGDPEHMCMGRSAPGRLKRALHYADEARLPVSKLREIFTEQSAPHSN